MEKTPKVFAVCTDQDFLEKYNGTGPINAEKAEELKRKADALYIDISFTCAGHNNDGSACTAQLKPLKTVTKASLLLIKGTEHASGCEYSQLTTSTRQQLSYRVGNFSLVTFHEAISKGKPYKNQMLDERMIDAQNLRELYKKLKHASLNDTTQDKFQIKNIILDSRTFLLHRCREAQIDNHPALVLCMTTPLYTQVKQVETYYGMKAIILQDPFFAEKNNPALRIHFILLFDDSHNSVRTTCENEVFKVARKHPDDDPEIGHISNNSIFLVEAEWKKITDQAFLNTIDCHLAYCGLITNKKQMTRLEHSNSLEDPRLMFDRTV